RCEARNLFAARRRACDRRYRSHSIALPGQPVGNARRHHVRAARRRADAGVEVPALEKRPGKAFEMNAPHTAWPAIRTPAQHFIGNRWRDASSRAELPMVDPSDGAPFAAIARGNAADIDAAGGAADTAVLGAWGKLAPAEKGRLLAALSRAIVEHADELALIEARDCGKPIKQARADVAACARYFEFYGGAADKLQGA